MPKSCHCAAAEGHTDVARVREHQPGCPLHDSHLPACTCDQNAWPSGGHRAFCEYAKAQQQAAPESRTPEEYRALLEELAEGVERESRLHDRVIAARGKDFYAGTWWDENGEAAWFPVDRFDAWEAVAGFAYYLSEGDLDLGDVPIHFVGRVNLRPVRDDDGNLDYDGRHVRCEDDHPEALEAWEVQAR